MEIHSLAAKHGTPLFVYEKRILEKNADELKNLQAPYGLVVRYAIKANSNPGIIKIFNQAGLHFDASSTYEAKLLLDQGIEGDKISLVTQSLKGPLDEVLSKGILPVASSLKQIELLASSGVNEVGLRINPGIGSGHSNRTNVGGPSSSFGIWHAYLAEAIKLAQDKKMRITRLHSHIGSGADPTVWREVINKNLAIAESLPEAMSLDIGGGYKIARMPEEKSTSMKDVINVFSDELKRFYEKTGRKIRLEIEPGTWLVANSAKLIATIDDIKDTGADGYNFLVIDTGMNDILRPSLYGAQHPVEVINSSNEIEEYIVVGHNCESGDILTPAPGDPEGLGPRKLKKAKVGDLIAIGGVGAYCASMSAKSYNSFPDAKEVIV